MSLLIISIISWDFKYLDPFWPICCCYCLFLGLPQQYSDLTPGSALSDQSWLGLGASNVMLEIELGHHMLGNHPNHWLYYPSSSDLFSLDIKKLTSFLLVQKCAFSNAFGFFCLFWAYNSLFCFCQISWGFKGLKIRARESALSSHFSYQGVSIELPLFLHGVFISLLYLNFNKVCSEVYFGRTFHCSFC